MSNVKRLEEALRADPDNAHLDIALRDELREQLGFSDEEADAHVTYIEVMARRARLLARASELLGSSSLVRSALIRAVRSYVQLESIRASAIHVVTSGEAPMVEPAPRVVAGEEWVVVIRVPAMWLIHTATELTKPVPRNRRRPGGDP